MKAIVLSANEALCIFLRQDLIVQHNYKVYATCSRLLPYQHRDVLVNIFTFSHISFTVARSPFFSTHTSCSPISDTKLFAQLLIPNSFVYHVILMQTSLMKVKLEGLPKIRLKGGLVLLIMELTKFTHFEAL